MSDISLNISGKIAPEAVALYKSVSGVAGQLNISFVVVGVSARDIVLHYGYGARIQRATTDIDFGIQVPNWSAFKMLKESLLAQGFRETRDQHRVISPGKTAVDGIQAGGIQVATPQGMTVLKLIAWGDRTADMRRKDAKDLLYLMTTYEKIPSVINELYKNESLMDLYDWEIELASAHQLGLDAKGIAGNKTHETIVKLFNGEHPSLSVDRLVEEMCERVDREYERNERIMNAFANGFLNSFVANSPSDAKNS